MKLLVLGSSGGCGTWICKLAVERGHDVRAVVRPNTSFDPPAGVQVVRGNVLDKSTLGDALEDRGGVLSALGIQRKSPKNPWSPIVSPPDLTTRVAEHLAELMPKKNVRRIVVISAAGVGESINRVHPIIRWMIGNSNMAASYEDLERMERVFRESSLEWTAVRPVTLTNGKPTGRVRETGRYGLFDTISRADVASRMLDIIESPETVSERTPMITS